jgi:CIC family chloride channel protein
MSIAGTKVAERLRLRENQIFLALTVLIGVISGLSAVLFTLAIKAVQRLLFGAEPTHLRLILVPTLVSFVTGFLLWRFFPDGRGSGIPQTEAAYHLNNGVIPGRVPFGKFITGVLCVGSGHSMGREGPSVQIGAGLASLLGRWFQLSPERVRSLVPIGAAAALSAAFNTPVAAVIFALEEIIGDMNAGLIGSTVVASVTSVIVERSILGSEPLFRVPAYHLVSPSELLAYAALGLIGGLISVIFCKGLLGARLLFKRLPGWSVPFQPAIGGLALGAILIFVPEVMGVGYEYVDTALSGALVLKVMLLLCAVKLLATIVSYSSGNAGGIFGPTLYLGAMAGGAVGILVHRFAPFPAADPGAYALVGMGALFAGIIRAPMTSVFMIFELTQDYEILVPLMVANMLSFLISKNFQHEPIYHALLEQDEIYLPGPESRLAAGTWRAKDLMEREPLVLDPAMNAAQAVTLISASRDQSFAVAQQGIFVGIVTRARIEEARNSGLENTEVRALVEPKWVHVHPDHPLELTLERYGQNPKLLPVLRRGVGQHLEGVINHETILRFLDRSAPPS